MSLVRDEHNKHLRLALKRFWQDGILTDVVIKVDGKRFKCHKLVLSCLSVYYETLFNSGFAEAVDKELELHLDCDTFEEVLNFMYCVTDTLNTDNAEKLFEIADFLQIDSLKDVLEQQLLRDLSVENCLEWFRLADLYNCPKLLESSLSTTANNLANVFDSNQFFVLHGDLICLILSQTKLRVPSEETLFEAVVKWYQYDKRNRKIWISSLIEHIRFPQMSIKYLEKKVSKEKFMKPLVRVKLVEEAKHFQSNPHLRHTYSSERTIPRYYLDLKEVNMFCVVGCKASKKPDGSYSQIQPTVHMFDVVTSKWYKLNYALHEKLANCTNFAVCPYGNGLYMSGLPRDSKGFAFFDVQSKVLSKRRQMTTPRMFHCLVATKDSIYALGGKNLEDERLSSVEMFNFEKRVWKVVGYLPVSVSDSSACLFNDKIYLFGGLTDRDQQEDPVIQCFDTKDNSCSVVACSNIPGCFDMPKSLLCDNSIFIVCGDGSVHEFFPCDGTGISKFEKIGQIQSFLKKHYYGCVQFSGSIYVFGGVGKSKDVISFDLKSKLTKYHSHLAPSTCSSVYGGFFTSTKLSGLTSITDFNT